MFARFILDHEQVLTRPAYRSYVLRCLARGWQPTVVHRPGCCAAESWRTTLAALRLATLR
jgi:hypothetical protein